MPTNTLFQTSPMIEWLNQISLVSLVLTHEKSTHLNSTNPQRHNNDNDANLLLRFHRNVYFCWQLFSFTSTLADTLCSMDVPRSLDSLTPYSHFPYHVPPARVLVRSCSRLTCFSLLATHTDMDSRLVPGYLFVSRFPFCLVDSYTYVSRLCISPFVSSTRLRTYCCCLCLSFCSLLTHLLSRYFWTLTRYWVISLSCIFVLVSRILLYIRVGDRTAPHLQSTLQPP